MVRRLAHLCVVAAGVVIVTFSMLHLIPGDPAQVVAGDFATKESIEGVRRRLGLDRPLYAQFGRYVFNLARLDLGESFRSNVPVIRELALSYPISAQLAVYSLAVATVAGVPLGVIAAVRRGSFVDLATMVVAMAGLSIPSFWLGLNLILLFSVRLGWLRALWSGALIDYLMPSVTLAMFSLALIARQTRSSMLEVLTQDYVRTARAKGLAERVVTYRHALLNALVPVLTVIGLNFGYILGGTVITESIFSMRGMGTLLVGSILDRDYPIVQAGILVLALNFAVINLATDLLYALIDPRIRYE
jgi:peptide/nickel transport system permease protein/oligopeptide transport system permease protein